MANLEKKRSSVGNFPFEYKIMGGNKENFHSGPTEVKLLRELSKGN